MLAGAGTTYNVAASNPTIYNAMYGAVFELNQTVFSPVRGKDDNLACELAVKDNGSFWGPYLFVEGGA